MKSIRFSRFVTLLMLFLAFRAVEPRAAAAQLLSDGGTAKSVTLNYTQAEILSLTVGTPTLNFSLVGSNSNVQSTNVTVNWNIGTGHTSANINVGAWFGTTTALASGTGSIPVTSVNAGWSSAAGTTPVDSCGGAANPNAPFTVANATCDTLNVNTGAPVGQAAIGTFSQFLNLQLMNLTGLKAGTYSGVLNLEAALN